MQIAFCLYQRPNGLWHIIRKAECVYRRILQKGVLLEI